MSVMLLANLADVVNLYDLSINAYTYTYRGLSMLLYYYYRYPNDKRFSVHNFNLVDQNCLSV